MLIQKIYFPICLRAISGDSHAHHFEKQEKLFCSVLFIYTQQKLRKLCLRGFDKRTKHLKTFEFHSILCVHFSFEGCFTWVCSI